MDQSATQGAFLSRQPKTKSIRVPRKLEIYLHAALAGISAALLSSAVEGLVGNHVHTSLSSVLDHSVAGLVAAACVFVLRYKSRQRRLLDRQRFELIAASTQQIRDALQLITDTAVPGTQQQRVVIYAVDHIEWVLQEVLPTVHQEPREVQERMKDYEPE